MRKERFSQKIRSKLSPTIDSSLEILERIGNNAYRAELPGEYRVSATFNVANLSPYLDDVPLENLRSNSIQQGEDSGHPPM